MTEHNNGILYSIKSKMTKINIGTKYLYEVVQLYAKKSYEMKPTNIQLIAKVTMIIMAIIISGNAEYISSIFNCLLLQQCQQ